MRARRRGRAPQWVLVRLAACLAMLGVLLLSGAPPARADRWYQPQPVLGVVDAGRAPSVAKHAGATWDRALFLWQQIQPNGPNDWTLDGYISQANLQPTLRSDLPLVGIVQGTPAWADTDYHDGAAGVPNRPRPAH